MTRSAFAALRLRSRAAPAFTFRRSFPIQPREKFSPDGDSRDRVAPLDPINRARTISGYLMQ